MARMVSVLYDHSAGGAAEVSPGCKPWEQDSQRSRAPEVRHMSHTYAQNVVHVVFSTKDRRKTISDELQPRLWAYIVGVCKKLEILVQAVGGTEDHLHVLIHVPPNLAVAKAVLTIKANSSRWINEGAPRRFAWQEGYGVFSVSHSLAATAVRYINNQKTHHRKMSFEDEFVALLKKHGVDYDPKFLLG
jgi:putative transposase